MLVEQTRFQSKTDQVAEWDTATHLVASLHMTYLYATNKYVQIRTTTWPNACSIDVDMLQTWNPNSIQVANDVDWYSKFQPQVVTHRAKHGFRET